MAELLINVGDGATYEDGDIISAFNSRRIAAVHAEHICHPQWCECTSDGLRSDSSLARKMLDRIFQFRFERVSRTQVKRIETDHLGAVISESVHGPADMDVHEYIARRQRNPKHRIFGRTGSEVWHGGNLDLSQLAMDAVWSDIQTNSDHRRSPGPCPCCGQDHSLWSMGKMDIRENLAVQVDEMTEAEVRALESPYEETFAPSETPRDPNGLRVSLPNSIDGGWVHPQGWEYQPLKDGSIKATFAKRNIKTNWEASALPAIGKTALQVRDVSEVVGRESTIPDLSVAPWLHGDPWAGYTLDHQPITDPGLLHVKRGSRRGERIR